MKKIVLLFTVLVLFAGCKHRKAIRVEDETPQNSEESFVLHPTIMAAIKEFGLSNHTDRIYAVYFTDTNDGFYHAEARYAYLPVIFGRNTLN